MSPSCCGWSTPSRRFAVHAAQNFANPRSSAPGVVTNAMRIVADFSSAASGRSSPGAAEHGGGLGRCHWIVERTHPSLHGFRRLRIRFERRSDIHEAFVKPACPLVCWNIFRLADRPFLTGLFAIPSMTIALVGLINAIPVMRTGTSSIEHCVACWPMNGSLRTQPSRNRTISSLRSPPESEPMLNAGSISIG